MRRIDIFVSSPGDVQKERSLVERAIRSIAAEFNVPIAVTYSNWLRKLNASDKVAAQGVNGSEDGRTWLCPCFWEYQDSELDQDYQEQIPNTGSYDLVISILWSRLGTKLSPAFIMPDGSTPKTAHEYEIAWVLDQLNRTPGFPELRVYRNRSTPPAPLQPRAQREAFFREWDAVEEFFAAWEKQSAFAEACSNYSDLQEFESLFREHFRDFLTRQLEKEIIPRKHPSKGRSWASEPFQGLQFFDLEHAPIFYGRTKAIGEVLDALNKQANAKKAFVLVLGASGSGKSSLVRAGVLPLLTGVGALTGPWRCAITRPGFGGDLFDGLAAALLADGALPELQKSTSGVGWRTLAVDLQEDPDCIALRIKEVFDLISAQELDHLLNREADLSAASGRVGSVELARHRKLRRAKPNAQFVIFIDQLEDLFTSAFSLELQQKYIAALAALARCEKVHVIAALRSEFYASYQRFPQLVALTNPGGRFDLQPPSREEVGKMIRSPAEASGLTFDRDPKTGQALDEALADAALASSDPLPLLEHLLSQLYRKQSERKDGLLRWADYRDLGEVDGALGYHAERVFTALDGSAQQAFVFVMRRLVSIERDGRASGRVVPYRDLVSSHELDRRLRAGAKSLVDGMVKEGLFRAQTDYRQEVSIEVAHPALLWKWPRVRAWLSEDKKFLRMRDRVDGCLKLWLKGGRQKHDLLSPDFGLADGEMLLNHFRSSLSGAQIEYIQKSLAKRKRSRRIIHILGFAVFIGLVSVAAIAGVHRFNIEDERAIILEYGNLKRKISELARTDRAENKPELDQAEEKARLAQQEAELAATQRTALEAQLKQAQDKLQQALQTADLAATQRSALEAQLKQAQDKLQQVQQDADLAVTQRSTLEAQLKQAQDKLQQVQQDADLAVTQRSTLEAQLKQAQDKLQQVQQGADLAVTQRSALEAQLKQAQDKLQQVQHGADLALTQRSTLEAQLKQAQDKLQQVQQDADLAITQRSALEAQLKKADENAKVAQQRADLAITQRGEMEAQLRRIEGKAQVAQKVADLVAAMANPEENGPPKGESSKRNIESPNQLRSGRALPLDAGQNSGPGISTQPLILPVEPATH
jgi:energy-coupling factor transporter ATP-binding protein EcfA2